MQTQVKDVPIGEYVRLKDSNTAPVWKRGVYDKASKTYSLTHTEDINRECFRKGTTIVYTGFTY